MVDPQIDRALNTTKQSLEKIVESFIELGVIVHDFQGTENSRDALTIRLNQTVSELQKLQKPPTKELEKVPIPLDVLQYIEDGRNPDVYTREFVEATRRTNQYLRGKIAGLKELRDNMGSKISDEFPELKEDIDRIITGANNAK